MRLVFHRFCCVLGLTLLVSASAYARVDASVPHVRTQQGRDFMRLTFEWPRATLFTAKTSGNNVILTFDHKANPHMGSLLKQMHPYVVKAERKSDGKTIVLTLDKPHRIRTFISDNIGGIDILDVKAGKQIKVTADSQKSEPQTLAKLSPAAGEESPAAPVASEEKTPEKKEEAAAPPPAEPAKETAPEKPQEAAAADAPPAEKPAPTVDAAPAKEAVPVAEKPAPVPTPKAEPSAPEVAKEQPKESAPAATEAKKEEAKEQPKEPPTNATAATVPTGTINAKDAPATGSHSRDTGVSMIPMSVDRNDEPVEEKKADEEDAAATSVEASQDSGPLEPLTTNKIVVSADPDGATLRFPLKERTAMAAFVRGNILWVVFDKKLDFDLADFEDLPQTVIGKATVLPNDNATVLRIPVSDNIFPSVKQQEGQLDLAILLSATKPTLDKAMELAINTEPPAPAHVFVPALEVEKTVELTDPDVGDTLSVTPFYTREQGVAVQRRFVEFTVLASTQGLAIVKTDDTTEVTVLRNGLRVSLPKGAHLSPQTAGEQGTGKVVPLPASGTLFPDELWQLEPKKSYKITMRNLFHESVLGANEGAKNLARLRMAQLYLRDGFVVEALGMLNSINRSNPSYFRSAKLSAMRGAANFLLYRFNDAARDFSAGELNNNPEIDYWRNMLADLLGNPDKTYDFLAMNGSYISKYPPIFRQRLAIVAADRAIAARQYNAALKIFDTLSKDNILVPIQPYVDFLTAKISSENGQEQDAMEVWKRLASGSADKFVQARATFSAVLWELDNNIITRDQAIDRLERLRLSWHGDGMELQIIQLLGDLYVEKSDFVNAMRVWQIAVTGFKNTGPAIEMGHKMEDTFLKLFNDGIADKMKPLEALALYYEYRNYSPSGAIGAQMIEKLSDRLVGVDLLSTAAQLLEQQMRTQMEKAERSRVGAKLADIYLLNNQPKRALKALQDSAYGDNPILLRIQRNQIAAKAMRQLGRPDEALSVLGQDESVVAEKLRALIYWSQQDWANLSTSIENMFKKRTDPSAPMDNEEGEFVLRLALAYVFQNDAQQLQYMRDYFGPLMRNNPSKKAFDFITTPDVQLNTRNFDDLLKSLSNTRDFVDNYKARIEVADAEPPAPVAKQP